MGLKILVVPLFAGALLAGCESDPDSHQKFGTLIGAAGGGLLGAQFGSGSGKLAAVALGTLGGAFIGNRIGADMDKVDRLKHQQAIDEAATAPVGETITWNNPDNGHSGSVKTVRDGTSSSGQYCREYQHDGHHRRQDRGSLRHRLPAARRQLENRLAVVCGAHPFPLRS